METRTISSTYHYYPSVDELPDADQNLIREARHATEHAYAPYSGFYVGVALRLVDGALIQGSNQENASSPVGSCAERVGFASASTQKPGVAIQKLAIAVNSGGRKKEPVSPCGLCRQTILEYEERYNQPIAILLAGEDDTILQFDSVKDMLPLPFTIRPKHQVDS